MSKERVPATCTILLGKVHNRLGGPARTVRGYAQGLSEVGCKVTIAGMGSLSDLHAEFGDLPGISFQELSLSPVGATAQLLRAFVRRRSHLLLVVGVWHLPFFAVGLCRLVTGVFRGGLRVLLVPTMSLTEYDWAKHRLVKALCRLPVATALLLYDGVVFASTGEQIASTPRTWRRSTVVLHPTRVPVVEQPGPPDNDLVFVGRLDPQKDLPLLIDMLARMPERVRLQVIGDGDSGYVENLRRIAANAGVAQRIDWTGWLAHDAAQLAMLRSKVVVITSVVENFCHVAAEALMHRRSVLLNDRVLSAEDLTKVGFATTAAPDPTALASAATALVRDFDAHERARNEAALRVRAACDPQAVAHALLAFASGASPA